MLNIKIINGLTVNGVINKGMVDTMQKYINEITNIMVGKLKVNANLCIAENYDKPLTGKVFGLSSIDLMYLFLEIEERFKMRIDTEKILNYEFNTINGIAELILGTEAKSLT